MTSSEKCGTRDFGEKIKLMLQEPLLALRVISPLGVTDRTLSSCKAGVLELGRRERVNVRGVGLLLTSLTVFVTVSLMRSAPKLMIF